MKVYEIAVVHGDGIGPEVCQAALDVLKAAVGNRVALNFREYDAGAETYRRTGEVYPRETLEGCRRSDAILHGAAGLPDVTYPDGTEAGTDFGLRTRFEFDLYANIRPIKLHRGIRSRLRDIEDGGIDYVIIRENTEGLYAARGNGVVLRNELAVDSLVVTRRGVERVCRAAFELARRRKGAPADGARRVTCCDKANVLRSYAFFRGVFKDVARDYPDVQTDFALVDAMTAHLIERPGFYDVIVVENMFGDIISDLAAATVGSMGMSPSSELGDSLGFFQAAHGSAPSLVGKGIANPYGTILAGAMMLKWLSDRNQDSTLLAASENIDVAVDLAISEAKALTPDIGGAAQTKDVVNAVISSLNRIESRAASLLEPRGLAGAAP